MSAPELQTVRRFTPAPQRVAPRRELRTASIAGLGTALPADVVGSDAVERRLGKAPGWVERRTGIVARRRLADGESLADLAAAACRAALDDAGVDPAEIDLVVGGTSGADDVIPHLAPVVAGALGLGHVAAWDVGAACTGFVAALSAGTAVVESGRARRALVIGADAMARWTDPDDGVTAALFGDGAGAVVLTDDGGGAIGPITVRSDAAGRDLIRIPRDRQHLVMDGHGTYRRAITAMHAATAEALEASDLAAGDIDLFVYHQANRRILASLTDRLGVDPARVVDAIAHVGNTSAASIPLALDQARAAGQLRPGARVLVGAAGSGFCWGAGVLTW